MGFLDTNFDLGDFIFSDQDLAAAREILPELIQSFQSDWLNNPRFRLGDHWLSDSPHSACFLIELWGIFFHLIGKISGDSPPKIEQKFGDLLTAKTADQLSDLITELQVARVLAKHVQPIVFEPLVPPWQTAAADKPRSPDYELQLPDGRMLLEVTVMRADADAKRTAIRSYADSVPKKCGQRFEVMRTFWRFRRNGVRDGSGRCPHSVGGVSAFRRNREMRRCEGS